MERDHLGCQPTAEGHGEAETQSSLGSILLRGSGRSSLDEPILGFASLQAQAAQEPGWHPFGVQHPVALPSILVPSPSSSSVGEKAQLKSSPCTKKGGLCSLCLPSCFFKGVPKTRSVGAYTRRVFEALVEGSIAQDWR